MPNSRLIWTREEEASGSGSSDVGDLTVKRTILGFGGHIEQCGALRLTDHDQEAGDDGGERDCQCLPTVSDDESPSSRATQADSAATLITGPEAEGTVPSATLFDADFDVTFDAKSGRWLVSNVNVLRR